MMPLKIKVGVLCWNPHILQHVAQFMRLEIANRLVGEIIIMGSRMFQHEHGGSGKSDIG